MKQSSYDNLKRLIEAGKINISLEALKTIEHLIVKEENKK